MLLDFRFENYKSFRDEALLSLFATKRNSKTEDLTLESHTFDTGVKTLPRVNASAAIYGANAGGKTNVLNALMYFQAVVEQSANLPVGQAFNVTPFKINENHENEPSEFEVTFLLEGVRHQYGFRMTKKRILEEWLLVYKSSKPQVWFDRKYNPETDSDDYSFSKYFTGQKDLWKKSTKGNSLFLSIAVQLNSTMLIGVHSWITKNLVFFGVNGAPSSDFTLQLLQDENLKQWVIDFMESADTGISDIEVIKRQGLRQEIRIKPDGKHDHTTEERELLIPQFIHSSGESKCVFEIQDESLGTQRLFNLAGPILDILIKGKILVFDELSSSFHTLLAQKLVEMFNNKNSNPNGAQLIFTSHDTELLNNELLRRDQIWFVEKDRDLASSLYPLTDFGVRKGENLEKGYLIGRYSAVPFLEKGPLGVFNGSR